MKCVIQTLSNTKFTQLSVVNRVMILLSQRCYLRRWWILQTIKCSAANFEPSRLLKDFSEATFHFSTKTPPHSFRLPPIDHQRLEILFGRSSKLDPSSLVAALVQQWGPRDLSRVNTYHDKLYLRLMLRKKTPLRQVMFTVGVLP